MGAFHSIIYEDGVIGGCFVKKRYPVITYIFTVDKISFAHITFRPDRDYCGMKVPINQENSEGTVLKVDIKRIDFGDDEVILRYKEVTPRIKRILDALNGENNRLIGRKDDRQVVVDTGDVLYIESVDDKTFAYTEGDVVRIDNTLQGITDALDDIRFFRCSKSMIINVDKVRMLKSLSSNRIDATLENGEHILISRTYASEFRKLLKGGAARE